MKKAKEIELLQLHNMSTCLGFDVHFGYFLNLLYLVVLLKYKNRILYLFVMFDMWFSVVMWHVLIDTRFFLFIDGGRSESSIFGGCEGSSTYFDYFMGFSHVFLSDGVLLLYVNLCVCFTYVTVKGQF